MATNLESMIPEAYNAYIEDMRRREYPMLKDSLYLDHAGTTLYSKTAMERFHADMMANLYGNPHSASSSSQRSTQDIEAIRLQALRYFDADPEHFDLVFTANTTAAIKLVMEAFREQQQRFWYGYHVDSHTSLVGVREVATSHRCFESDRHVREWIEEVHDREMDQPHLLAFPAQSNMNGRRLPLKWSSQLSSVDNVYTLLDAAAYAATSPLRLDNIDTAPDITVLSFTKIFGFPDLGGLIVKKSAAHLFERRKYFGGGTVDMVVCLKEQWHEPKAGALHGRLEDGTLPIHSILALRSAMQAHAELFSSLDRVAAHTAWLAKRLYTNLSSLRHGNGKHVCTIYIDEASSYGNANTQGPTIAFNLKDSRGRWVSNSEIEQLASIRDIHLRTGGLCNPGGIATCLGLEPWEMKENFSAGFRCGSENDIMNGKPTGVVRVSLGAMSTSSDASRFIEFVEEFFVDKTGSESRPPSPLLVNDPQTARFYVESLTVYPIKSCAGWRVPYDTPWDIHREGLAWDREWCVVKQVTGTALSQKAHPRMARIRPFLDFSEGLLRITVTGSDESIAVPLSRDPQHFAAADFRNADATVCGERVQARIYTSPSIADFFTEAIGVPCTLARFPAASRTSPPVRHSKAHLQQPSANLPRQLPVLLSNESPILSISRSSLNLLNEVVKAKGGKAAHPSVFRANIVLAESPLLSPGQEQPWAEDDWQGMCVGGEDGVNFDFLGGCRRCQMVCVDQESGEKNQEPFVTLAKTRRFKGRVLFGVHTSLAQGEDGGHAIIKAGDTVRTWT
ncbi:Molybdenum cofactor sulfurase [Fulvia fulva]|nr:Molybdenum cofactor sulfurase [Fulvia fulva]WPV34349.1 Molybdenum cofactor sulfurase [Fulvia fulva]